jgi:hypothetical protein
VVERSAQAAYQGATGGVEATGDARIRKSGLVETIW